MRVKCLGHIRTSVGKNELELNVGEIKASELIERLREMGKRDPRLGFTKFNTLIIVNDGEAFTAAGRDRTLHETDEVVLIPFSHGG